MVVVIVADQHHIDGRADPPSSRPAFCGAAARSRKSDWAAPTRSDRSGYSSASLQQHGRVVHQSNPQFTIVDPGGGTDSMTSETNRGEGSARLVSFQRTASSHPRASKPFGLKKCFPSKCFAKGRPLGVPGIIITIYSKRAQFEELFYHVLTVSFRRSSDMRLTFIAWVFPTLLLCAQESRLADAVRAGRYAEALKLLDRGADPNELDTRGNTSLMWAAAAGRIEVARALLDNQALMNVQHHKPEYDALHLAAQNQQTAMIDFLLSRGAIPALFEWDYGQYREKLIRIAKFVSDVENAVRNGNTSRLEALLAESPPDWRQSSLNGALLAAARRGDARLVQKLLDRKANPVSDRAGITALELAAESGHAEVVKLLISAGIRIELVREAVRMSGPAYPPGWSLEPMRMTPAVQEAFGEIAREPEAIAAAVRAGDAAGLNKLIQSGACAYWLSRSPLPPLAGLLKQATGQGYSEVVRMLSTIGGRREDLKDVMQRMLTGCRERPSGDCARINQVANWYLDQMSRLEWTANYSRDYFLSLQAMADTLQTTPEIQTVKEIAAEMETRRQYCIQNNVGMGGSVKVQVHTRNLRKEVPNWQVYYLLKIFEHNPAAAPGAFLKWSSPTSEIIEPGRYWFWAKDPATNRETDRKLVPLSGAQAVSVDLFVP